MLIKFLNLSAKNKNEKMMEQNQPKCTVCERNTKYMCIKCSLTLCNICAVSAYPTKEGYSEENKTVGLCKKYNDSNSLEVIVEDEKKSQNKQTSILSFFFKLKPQKCKTPSDTKQKQGASSMHTATAATAEKWKSEMAIHSVSEWLMYNIDKNGKINDMKCTVCTDYEKELKQFQT